MHIEIPRPVLELLDQSSYISSQCITLFDLSTGLLLSNGTQMRLSTDAVLERLSLLMASHPNMAQIALGLLKSTRRKKLLHDCLSEAEKRLREQLVSIESETLPVGLYTAPIALVSTLYSLLELLPVLIL